MESNTSRCLWRYSGMPTSVSRQMFEFIVSFVKKMTFVSKGMAQKSGKSHLCNEHLSWYTCWHTRVPSQTPGRLALHHRTSYIIHCKGAIFPIFEPSLLIQKSFFSQKKRWIRTSVTIHLLAYQSTFTKTRTSCSPSQNFLHFSLQMCDFPDFWAIPFDRKVIFFTKEKVNSNICHDTLVGIPEYLHKHQDVLLSIAELPTFFIAKVRFSRFLSHPFWYESHFFHKRNDEFEHLSRYTCWHTRVPSQTPWRVALHRRTSYILHCKGAILPILTHPFWYKSHFFHKRRDELEHLSRYTCWHTRVTPQTPGRVTLHRRTSYIFHCKGAIFPILSHHFWYKSHFFHKRRDEFEHLSRYTCWHTRVPSQTPGRLALHRRTSYIIHCKGAIFPIFEPSLLIQKSFFSQKKRWIRTSVTIHLLAYQSTFTNTRTCCSPSQNFLHFTLQMCDFPDFWAIPFDRKVIFFTKEKMNSNICHDTLVGIPEYLQKHQEVLLSIAEPPKFYIANIRFSRFLSHPFWYKSHFFHKRKDEFEHLSRYTCWHTRVPSQTPGRVAPHRRTSYILHCKGAIFQIFEPSLLIQKSFFSQKKRWIRKSLMIHLLAYQSTSTNTGTCCSPSQNFLHFSLQMCDFPDFWAIHFDTKVIFFTKEKMNSNICHDTLVGIPEYLHKHQDVLLSIAELPTFYIAKVRFSRFLSHPFWYKSHFFHKRRDDFEHLSRYTCWHTREPSQTPGRLALHRRTSYILHCKGAIFQIFEPSLLIQKSFFSQKKRWIRKSLMIHLLAYQSTFTNTRTCCSLSQNFLHFTLQRCDFPDFWAIPFDTKVIFFTKEEMNSNICHDTLVGIPEYLHKHRDVLLSIAELPTFFIANVRFSRFLSHPFWYKSHFFHKRKDEFEHLSRYTCWHTRVPSQTPGRVALHRRTSYILHCKGAIFPIFEPSLLIQKSFFSQKKRWIRTSVTIHLLAYQSTFTNTRTCCSPSQNFLHFTLQRCDFPDFWAIPFDTKVIFFTKEKMNSKISHDTLVGIPEYLHKHQDVLLPIAELPTFYIAKVRFSRFLSHPFWYKSHFFHKRRDEFEHLSRYTCWHTRVPSQTPGRVALHRRTSYILHCKCAIFPILSHPFWYKSHFFHKRKDEFEHLSRYTCWHTRVPSQTPGRVALHRRTSYILHCKGAIFPIFEPSLLIQKSFFSQKKRWIRTSVTIHLLAYQSTFTNTRTCCSPSQNFLHFTLQRCDFPDFWAIPFDTKVIFFTKEEMTSNICHDTLVGIPENLHKHQDVLLSIAELPTFYIANLRFSRFLSHPFWYKSHFFHKRRDEFEHLSRYTCWHTRVPSQTPGRVALHRRTSYILHCKCAIFPIFEPSLLIQKSFFSQKKRWIRTSVTIHLLAYQSTFTNTRTCCSPSQNFLHFTLQRCDFPDFWAIPFDTKVIFFTKEEMTSNICHDTLVGIPENLHKHQDVLLSIAELPTFYIAKVRFSRFLSHPFWYKSHFFQKRKDEFEISHDTLVGIPEYLHKHQDVLLPIAELPTFYIAKVRFSRFWAIPFDTKVIFFTKEEMNSNICHDTLVGIPEYLHKHQDVLLSIAELPTFYIAKVRFSRFLSHPFWYKSHFFHKRRDDFEHLSRYTCWHTREPSQTPGRPALHRRTSYILHCKGAIFQIFEPSLLIQKSFFSEKKRWIRKSLMIHLLAYQSTFTNTRTCCSPSQNFLHFTLQRCDFPDFEPSLLIQKSFFSQKKRWIRTSVTIHLLAYQSTSTNTRTYCSPSQNFLHFTLQRCDFPDFWAIPFDTKVIFFTKEKNSNICHDTLVGMNSQYLHKHQDVCHAYTCWHTRVPPQTPGRVALHRRTSYIFHCKCAIFPIFEPSLLIQKSFFSQKKRWIRTSVTIHLLAYQSTFDDKRHQTSPSQNFLHFTLQRCDFPDFWAIPFDTKVIFFTKEKMNSNISHRYTCWHTKYLHKHQDVLLSIAELPTFYIAKVRFSRFWAIPFDTKDFFTKEEMNSNICHDTLVGIPKYLHKHQDVLLSIAELPTFFIFFHKWIRTSLLIQKSFFSQKKRWIRTSVTIHLLAYQSTSTNTRTCCSPSQNFLHFL